MTCENNHFWISYSFINLPSFSRDDFKTSFFVIYAVDLDEDLDFMELLQNSRTKKSCNTILLITEDADTASVVGRQIDEYLEEHALSGHYQLIRLTREELKSLYESKDKVLWFDKHLRNEMELPV